MRGERDRNKRKFTKEHKDTCGDGNIHYLDFGDSFMGIYVCQLIKIVYFMCNLLYVNYISIKLFKKQNLLWYDQER